MNSPPLFSSERGDWGTPPELFARLSRDYGPFDLDAAATPQNALCERYITPEQDALKTTWDGKRIWLNPPYGRAMLDWMYRAADQAQVDGRRVVVLVPARTDTAWWHEIVMHHADCVELLRGRVRFVGAPASAPFPSAVVVFNGCGNCHAPRFIAGETSSRGAIKAPEGAEERTWNTKK